MKHKSILFMSQGAMIAALYVALTMLASALNLSSGAVQIRFSEALTVLPVFTPAAIPGLFVGCMISNLISGCVIWDVIFGSLATLIGALGTYLLRKTKIFSLLPPIAANTLIVPVVLVYAYGAKGTLPYFILTVGIGEIISCGVFGYLLRSALEKNGKGIKWS